ncbi:uncharacterized protein LOC121386919 [Gigantopelta aegis]|uniref:uncharacterized protein LOC121386919 n=1 Tax=Gigantopelta aegis TaxID=1735272 RepID=UPI001B88D9F6|nr:uncharacterized protein LOC121386919 [Gigantopelta aegis]
MVNVYATTYQLTLILTFLIVFHAGTVSCKNKLFQRVYNVPDTENSCLLWRGPVSNQLHCAHVCASDDRCVLFNHDGHGTCSTYCDIGTEFQVSSAYVSVTAFCPTPPPIANGQVVYDSLMWNSGANYSCDENYFFGRSNSSVCHVNGSWTGFAVLVSQMRYRSMVLSLKQCTLAGWLKSWARLSMKPE